MINFADSVTPRLIPQTFTHVAAYGNGLYKWSPAQYEFSKHITIAVKSGDPSQALYARALDVERYDARASDFPPFARERLALGHDDPTVYCSMVADPYFGLRAVVNALADAAYTGPWRLWVAWWWGRDYPPTAAEVLAEIRALTGLRLATGVLWACQWRNGLNYDTSALYGRDDFAASQ